MCFSVSKQPLLAYAFSLFISKQPLLDGAFLVVHKQATVARKLTAPKRDPIWNSVIGTPNHRPKSCSRSSRHSREHGNRLLIRNPNESSTRKHKREGGAGVEARDPERLDSCRALGLPSPGGLSEEPGCCLAGGLESRGAAPASRSPRNQEARKSLVEASGPQTQKMYLDFILRTYVRRQKQPHTLQFQNQIAAPPPRQ